MRLPASVRHLRLEPLAGIEMEGRNPLLTVEAREPGKEMEVRKFLRELEALEPFIEMVGRKPLLKILTSRAPAAATGESTTMTTCMELRGPALLQSQPPRNRGRVQYMGSTSRSLLSGNTRRRRQGSTHRRPNI